ncbi:hypothetical protein SLA2020_238380 [Shorea laevis]
MREEQVQMAVRFLSHPSVKGSPLESRRSFLARKGLTNEEINEAFHRVPDGTSSVTSTGRGVNLNRDVQLQPQGMVPLSTTSTGVAPMLALSQQSRFSRLHVLFALAMLAASGAGTVLLLKKFFLPRLKCWIRNIVFEEEDDTERNSKASLHKESTEAAKAAAAAAVNAARASLEILNSKKETRYFEAFIRHLDIQATELRSMNSALRKLEVAREAALFSYKQQEHPSQLGSENGPNSKLLGASVIDWKDAESSHLSLMKQEVKQNAVSAYDSSARRSMSPASMEPSGGQHPKSYMEILAMIQRGEKPPGIKDINDSPPNPAQPLPNPRLAPRMKPWEIPQPQNSSSYALPQDSSQLNIENALPWWKRNKLLEQQSLNLTMGG